MARSLLSIFAFFRQFPHLLTSKCRCCGFALSDKPLTLKLMSPLKDQTVFEEDSVTLTCKLSKPDQEVKWFRKDKVTAIQPNSKYEILSEGTTYSLTIRNASLADVAEYTCKCGMFITTKAKVAVKGEKRR